VNVIDRVPRGVVVSGRVTLLVATVVLATAGAAQATTSSGSWVGARIPAAGATVVVRAPAASASALVGDDVRVELLACAASCGYTWRVTSEPAAAVARYVSTKFRRSQASKGVVGGDEIESVTFLATGEGSTSIVLKYFPPGRDRQPTRTYRLQLRVR